MGFKKFLKWIIGKPGDAEEYEQRLANIYKYGASGMSGYKVNGQFIHYRETIKKNKNIKQRISNMFKKLSNNENRK